MPIAITCPSCKAAYKLADNMRGKKVVCRACKESIIVTSGGTAKRDEDLQDKVVAKKSQFRADDVVDAEEVAEALDAEDVDAEDAEDVVEAVDAEADDVEEVEEVEAADEAIEADIDSRPAAGKKRFRDEDEEAEEVGEAEDLDDDSPRSTKKAEAGKKRGMAPVLLIGGGVGVIAVAGVVALLVMGGNKESSGNTGAGTQVAGVPPGGPPGAPPSAPPSTPPTVPPGAPPTYAPGTPSTGSPSAPSVPATPPTTPISPPTSPTPPVKEPAPPDGAKGPENDVAKEVKIAAAKPVTKPAKNIEVRARMNEQQIYDRIVKSTVWVMAETKDRLKLNVISLGKAPGSKASPKSPGEEDPEDPPEEDEEMRKLPPSLTIISPKHSYTGSGSLISRKHRLILTNVHVGGDADKLIFHFPDYDDKGHVIVQKDHYREKPGIKGELVERVDRADVALVKLESVPDNIPVVPLAKLSARPGEKIHSIGSPGASEFLFNFTGGTIRGVTRDKWPVLIPVPETDFLRIMSFDCWIVETDATTNAGDSGGPCVDDWGRLIGIVQGGRPSAKKMNRSVDIREIHGIINKYMKKIKQTWEPETPEIVPAHLASLPQLQEKLDDGPAAVRVKAIRALADLGPDAGEAFGKIFKLQNDADASIRKAAREALTRIPPDKRDVPLLSEILKNRSDDGGDIRIDAAKFLARLGPAAKAAADVIADQLKDADPDLKKELFVTLLAVGPDAKHIPLLRESWRAADPEIRKLAGENLVKLGSRAKPALPVLIGALKESPDPATRLIAARAILAIGTGAAEAKPALRAALKDDDRAVAVTAARSLVKLGDADPVMPMLIEVLKTKTGDVRKQACQALASLGPKVTNKAAVEELISALDEQIVRADAAKALVSIGKFASEIVAAKMTKVLVKESRTTCIVVLDRINHVSANIYSALQVVEARDPDPANQKLAKRVRNKLTGQKGPG